MKETVIRLENVVLTFPLRRGLSSILKVGSSKNRSSYTALNSISLDIKRGEIVGIIGTNGCGKSTLLRVISGIYLPDEGLCQTLGKISLLSGLGTGFSSHQTGRENAILYGSILGYDEQKIREKLPEIIRFSELDEFIDEPIRTYSAGMKARLGLAVASAIEPELLLIDEVLGVGDPKFREKSTSRILEMVKNAGTVVIVSHSFGMLTEICDRIVLIDKGEIIADGLPQDSIAKYYSNTKNEGK